MSAACAAPLADETLLAWWAGELEGPDQERLEEHLFSCDECSQRGHTLAGVAEGVRGLVRKGALSIAVLPAVVEQLQHEGRRIRQYRLRPGQGVQCTVSPDDDVVLARLAADLGGVSRLDVAIRVDDGPELRISDLPFDPNAEEFVFAPAVDALRKMPAHVQRMRLLAVDPQGERVLGEYTFDHSPWPGA